jgi:hypothetical protein
MLDSKKRTTIFAVLYEGPIMIMFIFLTVVSAITKEFPTATGNFLKISMKSCQHQRLSDSLEYDY